jgi:hypothetical protein
MRICLRCVLLAQAYTNEKVAASPDTLAPLVNIIGALPAALAGAVAEGKAEAGSRPGAGAGREEEASEPGPSSSDVEVDECVRLVSTASKWASK